MPCAFFSFIAGVFVDLDHLIDYSLNHSFTTNLKFIYDACAKIDIERLYILMHSYEVMALLWILIYTFSLSIVWKAVAIGLTQHLILDQLANPINTYGYFLAYRIINGFDTNKIINQEKLEALR